MIEKNRLILGDCLEVMKNIPDESIDSIITDPPYGLLGNHKIETKFSIKDFLLECKRILKKDAFIAYFGMFPSLHNWNQIAFKNFKYSDEITWVKRHSTPFCQIARVQETIMIFKKGNPKYIDTKSKWRNIALPNYWHGLQNIQTIKRNLEALRSGKGKIEIKSKRKINDAYFSKFKPIANPQYREKIRIPNVWTFLPHNQQQFGKAEFNVKHPTVKPIQLLERLIKLITQPKAIVLDPFIGSGTTALACIKTGRNYIGIEIDKDYYEIAQKRIKNQLNKLKLF